MHLFIVPYSIFPLSIHHIVSICLLMGTWTISGLFVFFLPARAAPPGGAESGPDHPGGPRPSPAPVGSAPNRAAQSQRAAGPAVEEAEESAMCRRACALPRRAHFAPLDRSEEAGSGAHLWSRGRVGERRSDHTYPASDRRGLLVFAGLAEGETRVALRGEGSSHKVDRRALSRGGPGAPADCSR